MDLSRQRVGCFFFVQWDVGLQDDFPVVVDFVHIVDGDAGKIFFGGHHGLVHMLAVEAFATVFGQEGRMDVHNMMGIGLDEAFRNLPKEAGQYDEVQIQVDHFLRELGTVEHRLGDHFNRDAQILGSLNGIRLGVVADYVDDFNIGFVGEILGDTLQVGAVAGDEDGEAFHSQSLMIRRMTSSEALKSNQI